MMLSKPVYESLPACYVAMGIGAMIAVPSALAFASGLVLSISGLLILFKRRNYRYLQQLNVIEVPANIQLEFSHPGTPGTLH